MNGHFSRKKTVYIIEETWYRLHLENDKKTQISLFTQIKDDAMINVLYQEQIKKRANARFIYSLKNQLYSCSKCHILFH